MNDDMLKLNQALHEASVYGIGATSDTNQRVIMDAAKAFAALRAAPPAQELEAREALAHALRTAVLLYQNSVACVSQHHGIDVELNGLPGWLRDSKASIEAALAALPSSPAPVNAPHNSGERLPSSDAAEGAGEANITATVDHLRDTISNEWGSHLCYHDAVTGRRICDEDKHCRCVDIARAIVATHGGSHS